MQPHIGYILATECNFHVIKRAILEKMSNE